jgi:hypothetical protein
MSNWRILLIIGCLLIGSACICSGCGGSGGGSSNPGYITTPMIPPYIYTYTSSDAENHNHTMRLYDSFMTSPPSDLIDTSSEVLSHTHTMAPSQEQLASVNSGQSVTVTSSTATNPATGTAHYHTWTLVKNFSKASSASNNHSHELTIQLGDLTSPPAAGVLYNTAQALNHIHTVTLTQSQLTSLNSGALTTVTTSDAVDPVSGTSHHHTYTDLTKPW